MAILQNKPLNFAVHAGLLKKMYPQGKLIALHPDLVWECSFKPNPLSFPYRIKITYRKEKNPKIYVIGTKLSRGQSATLPHVYSSDAQSLCLHYPPEKAWTASTNIADTIVPWIAEWLFHYEIWVVTGEWNGGGTVH